MFNFSPFSGSAPLPMPTRSRPGCTQIGDALCDLLEEVEELACGTEHLATFREARDFMLTAPRAGAPISFGFARKAAGHAYALAESDFELGFAAAKWAAEGVSRLSGKPAGQVSDGVDAAVERAKANALDHFVHLDYAAVGGEIASRFGAVGPNARAAFRRAGSNLARAAVAQVEAIQAVNRSIGVDALRPDPTQPV